MRSWRFLFQYNLAESWLMRMYTFSTYCYPITSSRGSGEICERNNSHSWQQDWTIGKIKLLPKVLLQVLGEDRSRTKLLDSKNSLLLSMQMLFCTIYKHKASHYLLRQIYISCVPCIFFHKYSIISTLRIKAIPCIKVFKGKRILYWW